MKIFFLIYLILLNFTIETKASSFHTGQELYDICFDTSDFGKQSYCLGFITGVTDALIGNNGLCIPKNILADQLRDIILSDLSTNFSKHILPASTMMTEILKGHYSCKQE